MLSFIRSFQNEIRIYMYVVVSICCHGVWYRVHKLPPKCCLTTVHFFDAEIKCSVVVIHMIVT